MALAFGIEKVSKQKRQSKGYPSYCGIQTRAIRYHGKWNKDQRFKRYCPKIVGDHRMNIIRNDVKLYLITGAVDMRKGIDGYVNIVQNYLHMDLFDNAMFLFCNKHHDKLKILYWDEDGFWLFYKRLEKGNHFKWMRDETNNSIEISEEQYEWLMQGLKIDQKKSIHKAVKEYA